MANSAPYARKGSLDMTGSANLLAKMVSSALKESAISAVPCASHALEQLIAVTPAMNLALTLPSTSF